MKWRKRRRDLEIAPDEIFLDAANAPSFDQTRLEGRLERPIDRSVFVFLQGVLMLALVILIGQAWNLEILQGEAYAAESSRNSLHEETLFATRGVIVDHNGKQLAYNEVADEGEVRRVYAAPGIGHVLGYVSYPKKDANGNYYDTTLTGVTGIEAMYDELLSGENGLLLVERDALGNVKSQGQVRPPKNGIDLRLTIDERAQTAFYNAIKSLADRIPFAGGVGILMEVHTGALRALVSYPEYDPNILTEGSPRAIIEEYANSSRTPYLNRAVAGHYTPGSIVKPMEALGALTDGILTPDRKVNALGSLTVPNPYDPEQPTIFKDWKSFGVIDLRDAIAWSSDVYFYIVGGGFGNQKGLGIERLKYWYDTFGLTSKTGIEVPREEEGFVPTPAWKEETYGEIWRIGDTYHTAIGQYAMQVTPIGIARAYAAIANGGTLVRPTLIEGTPEERIPIPISKETLRVVHEGMRQAVTEGTSVGLHSFDYLVKIAGKTGTAQTGTRNQFHNSWAVGFFPYENPKYVYVLLMEQGPSTNTTGGVYAMTQVLPALAASAPEYFE